MIKQIFIWNIKENDSYAIDNEVNDNNYINGIWYTPLILRTNVAYPFITDINEHIKNAEESEIMKNLVVIEVIHNRLSKLDEDLKIENARDYTNDFEYKELNKWTSHSQRFKFF